MKYMFKEIYVYPDLIFEIPDGSINISRRIVSTDSYNDEYVSWLEPVNE